MELSDYRKQIDEIDDQITELFQQRMDAAAGIARVKRENNLPVYDPAREREKLGEVSAHVRDDLAQDVRTLYATLFELSRAHQRDLNRTESQLGAAVREAIENTPRLFPEEAVVACQGVEGAYSQRAAVKLFKRPSILYFKTFESVFSAIESGLCRYGVLPIENSSAGSVKKVYDLMLGHDFKIVRSVRLKIDHSLLALPGVKREDIREIFTHEQAIGQCAGYLERFGADVKITRCENTAQAAQMLMLTGRRDAAAIASADCAQLYGLRCLEHDIQDRANNYTRFICISKNLEIYPGADHTSVMMTLKHQPGALCRALSLFNMLGINLTKLESRPIPERDFEFMFYFDLEASVYSAEFMRMIDSLSDISDDFRYLGSYGEVI